MKATGGNYGGNQGPSNGLLSTVAGVSGVGTGRLGNLERLIKDLNTNLPDPAALLRNPNHLPNKLVPSAPVTNAFAGTNAPIRPNGHFPVSCSVCMSVHPMVTFNPVAFDQLDQLNGVVPSLSIITAIGIINELVTEGGRSGMECQRRGRK